MYGGTSNLLTHKLTKAKTIVKHHFDYKNISQINYQLGKKLQSTNEWGKLHLMNQYINTGKNDCHV